MIKCSKLIALNLLVLFLLSACSTQNSRQLTANSSTSTNNAMTEEDLLFYLLRKEYNYWQGTPYRLGGNNKKGIDCSALVQNIYRNSFNIQLPRGTTRQAEMGSLIYKNNLKIADLVFFKTGWKARHVGIYLGDRQFLHASTSKGVMVSSLDNVYWRAKYWQSRRVIDR